MAEPYKSYVNERAENIAAKLATIVGDTNVQLCPRAILPEERYFPAASNALVYGCITSEHGDGYKTVLYDQADPEAVHGVTVGTLHQAAAYASTLISRGDRVRVKDPKGTNCMGQSVASSVPEVCTAFEKEGLEEVILMPHLSKIADRFSAGTIRLGGHGTFQYVGREYITTTDEEAEKYAGVDLIVARHGDGGALRRAAKKLDMPDRILALSKSGLNRAADRMVYDGRVSVDLLSGTTDSGRTIEAAVDITPRVGNNTPAEIEAIAALKADPRAALACASVRLHFKSAEEKTFAALDTRYVDSSALVVAAKVTEVE
jgi:hypothetical protein